MPFFLQLGYSEQAHSFGQLGFVLLDAVLHDFRTMPHRSKIADGVRCGVYSDAQNVRGSAQNVLKCATC
jgi:hypothetical protein